MVAVGPATLGMCLSMACSALHIFSMYISCPCMPLHLPRTTCFRSALSSHPAAHLRCACHSQLCSARACLPTLNPLATPHVPPPAFASVSVSSVRLSHSSSLSSSVAFLSAAVRLRLCVVVTACPVLAATVAHICPRLCPASMPFCVVWCSCCTAHACAPRLAVV